MIGCALAGILFAFAPCDRELEGRYGVSFYDMIRTWDLTSSERSSNEAKGAGPMRFCRRDGTFCTPPGDDMVVVVVVI